MRSAFFFPFCRRKKKSQDDEKGNIKKSAVEGLNASSLVEV